MRAVTGSVDLGRAGGARCERGALPMLPQGGAGVGGAHARHNNKRDSALASRVRLQLRFFVNKCRKDRRFKALVFNVLLGLF